MRGEMREKGGNEDGERKRMAMQKKCQIKLVYIKAKYIHRA